MGGEEEIKPSQAERTESHQPHGHTATLNFDRRNTANFARPSHWAASSSAQHLRRTSKPLVYLSYSFPTKALQSKSSRADSFSVKLIIPRILPLLGFTENKYDVKTILVNPRTCTCGSRLASTCTSRYYM